MQQKHLVDTDDRRGRRVDGIGVRPPHSLSRAHLRAAELVVATLCLATLVPATVQAQVTCFVEEVASANLDQADWYGFSVDIAGTRAAIGAPNDDQAADNAGAVYILERNGLQATNPINGWLEVAKLTAGDAEANDQLGYSVAISRDARTIVAGARRRAEGGYGGAGAAYVFFLGDDGQWRQQAKLVPTDPAADAGFGVAVAIDGDYIVVGAPYGGPTDNTGARQGTAYVFQRIDTSWTQQQILEPTALRHAARFGSAVAISGTGAIVGAYRNGSPETGAGGAPQVTSMGTAHVFRQVGGIWSEHAWLRADDWQDGGIYFGTSVAIDRRTAVVGAHGALDSNGDQTGAAYVFRFTGTNWEPKAKLLADNGTADDAFGSSVAVRGDLTLIGARDKRAGAAYLFSAKGSVWQQESEFLPLDDIGSDRFGNAVALSAEYVLVGAYRRERPTFPSDEGAAYLYGYGSALDCNLNGFHDDCEILLNPPPYPEFSDVWPLDTNANGTLDECECSSDADCTDHAACAIGTCHPNTDTCTYTAQPGFCLIDHECHADGEIDGDCWWCESATTSEYWSPMPLGSACGDQTESDCDLPNTCGGFCLANFVPVDTPCNLDDLFCNGVATCAQGTCHAGSDPCAPLGLACDEVNDECDCNDGSDCDDGLFCNGAEVCVGVGTRDATCGPGTAPCLDPPRCSEDEDLCLDCTVPAHCDDGLFCTGDETCVDGYCSSSGDPCAPLGMICNETDDLCVCDDDGDCDDANDCTDDVCLAGACAHEPTKPGMRCGDQTEAECDRADTCNGFGHCDPRFIVNGTPCTSDDNECTNDVCFGGVCANINLPPGTVCGSAVETPCDHPDTCDGDGHCSENLDPDCNGNGIGDGCDIADGTSGDCNQNGIPDECDVRGRPIGISGSTVVELNPFTGRAIPFPDLEMAYFDDIASMAYDPNSHTLYAIESNWLPSLVIIDLEAGHTTVTPSPYSGSYKVDGLAFDATTDTLYGTIAYALVNIDIRTGGHATVGLHDLYRMPGLAFDANTNVFYTARYGYLYTIDPVTVVATQIGNMSTNIEGLAFDPQSTTLYGTDPDTNELFIIDTETAQATVVGETGYPDIRGLTVIPALDADCDGNDVPDACEIDANDCNNNRILDACEPDCNATGLPDDCEIDDGTSDDCNSTGLPDECELVQNDCNGNAIPDDCELLGNDCDDNSVLDECEPIRVDKLIAPEGASNDFFGSSVAIDGAFGVIGAPSAANPLDRSGAAYVFYFNGSQWSLTSKLGASDTEWRARFGSAVDLSGDVLIVGARLEDGTHADSGAAYIFRFDGSQWVEEQKLTLPDGAASDEFGGHVAVVGDLAVVGASLRDAVGTNSGAAYVYRYNGFDWDAETTLIPSDAGPYDRFGCVAVTENTIVVGARFSGSGGKAYVFRYDGQAWTEDTILQPSDATDGGFGRSVAIDSRRILIGAPYGDDSDYVPGSAYVFRDEAGAWVEEARIVAFDAPPSSSFGIEVAIADNKAVIGTHHYDRGAAYVFHAVGGHWVEQAKLTPTSNGENRVFGSAVDIWETTALVGAYRACDSSSCAGAAMIYGVGGVDCNENGVFDLCELQDSASGSDCNDNLIPDECEPDCNATGLPDECDPITFGDFDGSGKVDLYDHHAFAECMGGPGGGASPGDLVCRNACLLGFDGDADGDVDLKDAAGFARLFSP